jgi:hypothetical protein
MTIEEAISYITHHAFIADDVKDMAIAALEKQIPKKPYIQQIEVDYYEHDCYECPNCDSFLGYVSECKEEHYQNNYCPECGQKIDWSEVEE